MALVLLAGCLLLVSAIMQRTTQYQRRSESLLEAAGYADEVMDDVREWARVPANYDGAWTFWDGRTTNSATYPGIKAEIHVQSSNLAIYSPDFESEKLYAVPGRTTRVINEAAVLVRIRAGRDLASSTGRVEVFTMVGSPSPQTGGSGGSIVVSGSGTLAPNAQGVYTARAFDAGGRELPQCCFDWDVNGRGGDAAEIRLSRDGRTFGVGHTNTRWDDTLDMDVPASGPVAVQATARIMGTLVRGELLVNLAP